MPVIFEPDDFNSRSMRSYSRGRDVIYYEGLDGFIFYKFQVGDQIRGIAYERPWGPAQEDMTPSVAAAYLDNQLLVELPLTKLKSDWTAEWTRTHSLKHRGVDQNAEALAESWCKEVALVVPGA